MIKDFNFNANDKKIFNNDLKNKIPGKMFDFHVHITKKEHVIGEVSQSKKEKDAFLNFDIIDEFTFEDFKNIVEIMFPGIEYNGLFFSAPFREIDIDLANEMIAEEIIKKGNNGLFIPRPEDSKEFIEKNIVRGRFIGFKPYPEFAIGKDYRENLDRVSILDFLTTEHLELADKYSLVVILHIPKSKRLLDEKNIEDIIFISKNFPRLKLILAHAGRSFCICDIINCIKKIHLLSNVYVDTAMINNWEVIEILLDYLGSERILFGSDFPIAALRGKNICVNNKHYFFTAKPYPWSVSNKNLNEENITFFLYEEIREILKAVCRKKFDRKVIDNIFYNNAINLMKSVNI